MRDWTELARRFLDIRATIEESVRDHSDGRRLTESVSRYKRTFDAILEASQSLLDDPDSEEPLLAALASLSGVRAAGHMDVQCDHNGGGIARHRWFAACRDAQLRAVPKKEKTVGDLELAGVLADRWDLSRPGYTCDADRLEKLRTRVYRLAKDVAGKTKPDPLRRYLRAFGPYVRDCTYVIIGRLGRNVATGSCDLDPHCEFKRDCALFAKLGTASPGKDNGRWRKRIVAVDLLFLKSPAHEDKARLMLVQTASLLRSLRAEREEIEGALLRGLPELRREDQRLLLRRMFDYCKAMKDARLKGAAFERLANGLLRLVPGWIPGESGRDTAENQLDLTVMVEPAVSAAKYWFEIFGPKIIIECKNYPPTSGGLPRRIDGQNPVRKLHRVVKKAGVRLGLLLNTGPIPAPLRAQATELSGPECLLVLLDGRDLGKMVENPGDAEHFMKQKISDAAIGVTESLARPAKRKSGAAKSLRVKAGRRRRF